MKSVKIFFIDLAISILILLPCSFICDTLCSKAILDWLDIQIGLSCFAVIMLITNILLVRRTKERRITKIVNSVAIIALASTLIYGVFMILEWLFPKETTGSFTGNWELWFPVSISLATFLHLQERHRAKNYKNENNLVLLAEYDEKAEAETLCAMLKQKGINAMTVEKGSPMYINSESGAPVEVQVMCKDLQSAKKIIK